MILLLFFFFKQKTAYEMRISDWSSDVCSSDLIVPVTAFQQNCTLLWCTATNKAAFVDPGGDLPKLKEAVQRTGVEVEKILVTHGHMDHCGQAGMLAKELGVPIEGPHEDDRFWIEQFAEDGARFGMVGETFEPRSEEHTYELQSLMSISYAVFCLKK